MQSAVSSFRRGAAAFAAGLFLVGGSAVAAPLNWDAIVIRNATSDGTPPVISETSTSVEFAIEKGGQKAALGTSLIDGVKISDIGRVAITRNDNNAAGGSQWAPYMNFWVTDGAGRYAVLANEPSDPQWNTVGVNKWDATYGDLSNKVVKVFEKHPSFTLPASDTSDSYTGWTFSDFANYIVDAPDAAYLAAGNGTGGGAPDEIGTNLAYGFNWVFGDTQANYLSGANPGYQVSNPVAVPEPTSAAVLALAAGAIVARRRRRA